jgi:hypothetical protein
MHLGLGRQCAHSSGATALVLVLVVLVVVLLLLCGRWLLAWLLFMMCMMRLTRGHSAQTWTLRGESTHVTVRLRP